MPGQVYSVSTLGGYMSQPYLSDRLRHVAQPEFRLRQFVDAKEAIGRNRGDTFLFDKAGNVQAQGGTLVETQTIPQTNFITNQGTAVIAEYGNSIPWTGKVENLAQFSLEPIVEQKLRDDMVKVLESAAGAQFAATEFIAVMSSTASVVFTTNGTATASATSNLTASNVRDIVNYMKKKLIPKTDGRNYTCVASVTALAGLHADTASGGWIDISKYTDTFAKNLHNGEVGTFFMTRFVEETGYLSNVIGNSSAYGQAVFFGSDVVYEAVAIPEEVRTKISLDYGRDMGLAWYALLGFKKVWDYSVDSEQHILFVTSA
jgi:N4-gp56 family major capsid protein